MTFNLNHYIASHQIKILLSQKPNDYRSSAAPNVPRITCKDGFRLSVQASNFHYCEPRADGAFPYSRVEVGFPSEREGLLMCYKDGGDEDPTDSVYGHVPVDLVEQIIESHGGLADETP